MNKGGGVAFGASAFVMGSTALTSASAAMSDSRLAFEASGSVG